MPFLRHISLVRLSPAALAVLRVAASAAVIILASAYAYYPRQHWIQILLAAFSVFGIHGIPTARPGPGPGSPAP